MVPEIRDQPEASKRTDPRIRAIQVLLHLYRFESRRPAEIHVQQRHCPLRQPAARNTLVEYAADHRQFLLGQRVAPVEVWRECALLSAEQSEWRRSEQHRPADFAQ